MNNVFWREIKANSKSLLMWSIGIILLVAVSMGKYAGMSSAGQSINDFLAQMPHSLKAIMGIGIFDLTTAAGYYAVLFIYLSVIATIHAAILGADIIAKEERDKTADFLFIKPLSRSRVISSKLLAAFVNILVFNIITLVSSIIMVQYYNEGEPVIDLITKLMAGMLIMQLIFLFLGTALAAFIKSPQIAPSYAAGTLLITFIISIVIDINSRAEGLKYLTPFKYFDAKNIIYGRGFEPVYLILSCIIITVFIGGTYILYKNRDLKH